MTIVATNANGRWGFPENPGQQQAAATQTRATRIEGIVARMECQKRVYALKRANARLRGLCEA